MTKVPTSVPTNAPINTLPNRSGPSIYPKAKKIMISNPNVQNRYGLCALSKEKHPTLGDLGYRI